MKKKIIVSDPGDEVESIYKDLLFVIEEFEDGNIDAYKLVKLIKEKIKTNERRIFN